MWNDFNHAWLGTFQAQKDLMEGGQLRPGQSLITEDNLQKMGDDLVRLCDNIERHGLVDYQYGVWEQQIEDSKFPPPCYSLVDFVTDTGGKIQSLRSAKTSITLVTTQVPQPRPVLVVEYNPRSPSKLCGAPVYTKLCASDYGISYKGFS